MPEINPTIELDSSVFDDHDASSDEDAAVLKVIGVGGGGGNAVNNMIQRNLKGVDFITANTDKQALKNNLAKIRLQVGRETTRGKGAGANPEKGRKSFEENIDEIKEHLKGADMIFVTAGMGGGTGTGGAPIVAAVGRDIGALVVAIVTKPFLWEGGKRMAIAEEGIERLRENVDALIVIPNQKLLDVIEKDKGFLASFAFADEVLYNATKGIADIISTIGIVNVDFADVKTVMENKGEALMGIGVARGENRAAEATQAALNSPLLDGISVAGSEGVLININAGSDLQMQEVAEVVSNVEAAAGSQALIIHGVVVDPEPKEEFSVTVVATGFNSTKRNEKKSRGFSGQGALFGNDREDSGKKRKEGYDIGGKKIFSNGGAGTGSTRRFFSQSPKGRENLKELDDPAFRRRQIEDSPDEINRRESRSGNSSKNPEGAAFLRRIMD